MTGQRSPLPPFAHVEDRVEVGLNLNAEFNRAFRGGGEAGRLANDVGAGPVSGRVAGVEQVKAPLRSLTRPRDRPDVQRLVAGRYCARGGIGVGAALPSRPGCFDPLGCGGAGGLECSVARWLLAVVLGALGRDYGPR